MRSVQKEKEKKTQQNKKPNPQTNKQKKRLQYARGILKLISSFLSKLSLMAASPAAPSVSCISDLAMQVTVT